MLKQLYYSSLLSILLLILSSSTSQFQHGQSSNEVEHSHNNPLINGLNETIDFNNIRHYDIIQATEIVLQEADKILEAILAVPDSMRTFQNTILC